MHIALFYQYYNTFDCAASGRHFTFLNDWHSRHELTLITTRTWRDRRLGDAYDWVPSNVALHQFDVPYDNAWSVRRRARAYGHFAAAAVARGLRIPRPDVILGVATPLTAVWAAATVARFRRVPWVFEVKDLWPDFPIQMGAVTNRLFQRRLYALEQRLYHRAAHVVTLSPDMEAHVRGKGIPESRVTTILNGTELALFDAVCDVDLHALREAHGLPGKEVVLYAGSFGRANDVPTLLAAAERLRDRPNIRFVFIGHGYDVTRIREAAGRLPNVTLLDPMPKYRVAAWFKLASLSVVSFIDLPVLAANSPTKLYDSLAAGTPVIVTNPGWSKRFVETHACGWAVPPSSPDALAARIVSVLSQPAERSAAGRRGADLARASFDRTQMSRAMEDILLRVAGRS